MVLIGSDLFPKRKRRGLSRVCGEYSNDCIRLAANCFVRRHSGGDHPTAGELSAARIGRRGQDISGPGGEADRAADLRDYSRGSEKGTRLATVHGGADDVQIALGEYLAALLDLGAFEPHDERHVEAHFLVRHEQRFHDCVALHDAAEDIDEHGPHVFVQTSPSAKSPSDPMPISPVRIELFNSL